MNLGKQSIWHVRLQPFNQSDKLVLSVELGPVWLFLFYQHFFPAFFYFCLTVGSLCWPGRVSTLTQICF